MRGPLARIRFKKNVWHFPGRTQQNGDIDIPLCQHVVDWFMGVATLWLCGSQYVLPARKMQSRMIPHIHISTHTLPKLR